MPAVCLEIEAQTPLMLELLRELGATRVKNPNAAAILKRAVERLLQVDWDQLPKREVDSLLRSNDTDLVLQLAGAWDVIADLAPPNASVYVWKVFSDFVP